MATKHRIYKTAKAIIKHFEAIYEKGGQSAVADEALHYKSHPLVDWEWCDACQSEVPSVNHTCLNCGQDTNGVSK